MGAKALGSSLTTDFNLVPNPPANTSNFNSLNLFYVI